MTGAHPNGLERGQRSPAVLIIAPADDPHACVVAKRLEELDAEPVILDCADFPSQWQLTVTRGNRDSQPFTLKRDQFELSDENLLGVWWRRPRGYIASSEVQEEHLRRFVASESRAAFEGWLYSLGDRVINPIAADRAASYKLLQLQCAVEVGLTIPSSMATNSPVQARNFYEATGPETVYKPFTAADWQLFPTQRISADALQQFETISYAPVIFQEEIKKIADIRVSILDGEVFPVMIRTERQDAPIDWRVDPHREYLPHELPPSVKAALVALMKKLGLRFAACDLALTGDGEYVFFEANTGGQWLFAEIMAGQEISWAFARALLRSGNPPPPRRESINY